MAMHWYIVVSVPTGCTEYTVDDEVERDVAEPPPAEVIEASGPCAGAVFQLIESKRAAS